MPNKQIVISKEGKKKNQKQRKKLTQKPRTVTSVLAWGFDQKGKVPAIEQLSY